MMRRSIVALMLSSLLLSVCVFAPAVYAEDDVDLEEVDDVEVEDVPDFIGAFWHCYVASCGWNLGWVSGLGAWDW